MLEDYIKRAKKILFNEAAGSEGFCYLLKYRGELKEDGFTISEKKDGDVKSAKITFNYPHDYGFALSDLKAKGIQVVGLELLF